MKNIVASLKNVRGLSYHIIGWLIFIAYEVIFVTLIRGAGSGENAIGGYLLPYLINICLFYFHSRMIITPAIGGDRRSYILFIILTIAELSVYVLIMLFISWAFHPKNGTYIAFLRNVQPVTALSNLWRGLYFLIFSTAYWFVYRYFANEEKLRQAETRALRQKEERNEVEIRLISTQNAFLRSQINPHLLFNTLNFIYSEIQEVSPKASEAILILSEMMRYSLSEAKVDGKVPIESEIEQIEHLININQFRFNNKLCLRLNKMVDGNGNNTIFPLLLVPFVENIFKYAELQDKENPASVFINVNNNNLSFETTNLKKRTVNFYTPGIGIENVKKRLIAFYPNNYTFNIRETETIFSVHLSVNL